MTNGEQVLHSSEKTGIGTSGWLMLAASILLLAGAVVSFISRERLGPVYGPVFVVLFALAVRGFYSLQPNEAAIITLFGRYAGTDRQTGLRWVPFWYARKKSSLRARNVTTEVLKVNDKRGNPVEIAANVVWRISDTARAFFDVDNYEAFVRIQIETGLRTIASRYAYDHGEEREPTLRDAETVSEVLRNELRERVAVAGIGIEDARISHLAYAPEIAGAMLRRQQAQAVVAARKTLVEGAVGMVEMALEMLSEKNVVELDDERRAAMVSNLMVVLCGERDTQPVVNTGTLYT